MRKLLTIALITALIVSVTPMMGINMGISSTGYVYADTIPIDEEHFPDTNFRNYLTEKYGSYFDPTGVISLDVSNLSIESLEGIQYFTDLESLDCSYNILESFDVSHNKGLRHLDCSANSFFSMDVSQNTALVSLICDKCINLSYLDVSHNTALETLSCAHVTHMNSLDVSHNTALVSLNCTYNYLRDLDVSHNTALVSLICDNNNLKSLDVSQNTALVSLICNNNSLTSLDASHNAALVELICGENYGLTSLDVSNNTALASLNCAGNRLSSLDVSNNTALVSLNCASTRLSGLDVSNNTALEILNCINNEIKSLNVSNNTALLKLSCDTLNSLDVSHNKALKYLFCGSSSIISSLDLSHNTALEELHCVTIHNLNNLDLSHNTALKELYCSYNENLSSLDVSNNTALEIFECHLNNLSNLDVSNNTALKKLDCSSNKLSSLDVSNNTALTYLDCTNNNLGKLYVCEKLPETCYYDYGVEIIYGEGPGSDSQEDFEKGVVEFNYEKTSTKDKGTETIYYTNDIFRHGNDVYDHMTAADSLCLAMAGIHKEYVTDFFEKTGFRHGIDISPRYDYPKTDDKDEVAYAFATKKVDGDTIIAVVLRGIDYGNEWGSNGRVGHLQNTYGYHYGFNKAADYVIDNLKIYCRKHEISLEDASTKIWLTGYSRSAAVANCVGTKLESTGTINKNNLYCYTFATPRTVTSGKVYKDAQGIFNIVNPVDIVPCVPLNSSTGVVVKKIKKKKLTEIPWNYTRHGHTLELPSAIGTWEYGTKLDVMKAEFREITGREYKKFNGLELQALLDILSSTTKGEKNYVLNLQDQIIVPALEQFGEGITEDTALMAVLLQIPGARRILSAKGFIDKVTDRGSSASRSTMSTPEDDIKLKASGIENSRIMMQHWPETYLAWMKTGYEPKKASFLKAIFVQCPVDVEVYDSNGNLVASIQDDVVDDSIEGGLEAFVDEAGAKVVNMPSDCEYRVELKATDNGTMTYSVVETDEDKIVTRKVIYENIEIEDGQVFTGNVNGELNTDSDNYALESNGEIIGADYDLCDEDLNNIEIKADIVGDGIVMGEGLYTIGDSVVLDASPLYDNEFIGWYTENDELITNEPVITTVAKEAVTYKAKFTEADVTPEDPTPVDPQPAPVVTPTTPAVTAPAEIQDLPAVKISKPAAAKKSVNIKWKKVSKKNLKKIQGIEIQVATNPDFTNLVKTATAGKKKTSKKIKGLTSKQTYYVRIRAYKDAADGKHVSAWKAKKVKVK